MLTFRSLADAARQRLLLSAAAIRQVRAVSASSEYLCIQCRCSLCLRQAARWIACSPSRRTSRAWPSPLAVGTSRRTGHATRRTGAAPQVPSGPGASRLRAAIRLLASAIPRSLAKLRPLAAGEQRRANTRQADSGRRVAHKPEAPAKRQVLLRWRVSLVCRRTCQHRSAVPPPANSRAAHECQLGRSLPAAATPLKRFAGLYRFNHRTQLPCAPRAPTPRRDRRTGKTTQA